MNPYRLWRRFGEVFLETPLHPQFVPFAVFFEDLRRSLPSMKGLLLDLGCGSQPYRKIIEPFVERYVGFDYPAAAREIPSERRPEVHGDALSLPFRDECADTLLAFDLLEHLTDPRAFLAEAARVLRPGGRLFITTVQGYHGHMEPRDYFRFTRHGLTLLAEEAGLAVEREREVGNLPLMTLTEFNTALLAVLKNLVESGKKPLAAALLPAAALLCSASNLLAYPLRKADLGDRCIISHFAVVRKPGR